MTQVRDRPFNQRPYGRLRVREDGARRLKALLEREWYRLHAKKAELDGPEAYETVLELREVERLLDDLRGVIAEKGWA
jgi:hypothetical protein